MTLTLSEAARAMLEATKSLVDSELLYLTKKEYAVRLAHINLAAALKASDEVVCPKCGAKKRSGAAVDEVLS